MSESERSYEDQSQDVRNRWPSGLAGWLRYFVTHRVRGFLRPVDSTALWSVELCGGGLTIFANGGAMALFGAEIDVLRLCAQGRDDEAIANALRIRIATVARLRAEFASRLGVRSTADFAQVASTYPELR